jgi:hypothetical protein
VSQSLNRPCRHRGALSRIGFVCERGCRREEAGRCVGVRIATNAKSEGLKNENPYAEQQLPLRA